MWEDKVRGGTLNRIQLGEGRIIARHILFNVHLRGLEL